MKLSYVFPLAAATLAFVQVEGQFFRAGPPPGRYWAAATFSEEDTLPGLRYQDRGDFRTRLQPQVLGFDERVTQQHAVKLEAQHREKAAVATEHAHQDFEKEDLLPISPELSREIREREQLFRGGADVQASPLLERSEHAERENVLQQERDEYELQRLVERVRRDKERKRAIRVNDQAERENVPEREREEYKPQRLTERAHRDRERERAIRGDAIMHHGHHA